VLHHNSSTFCSALLGPLLSESYLYFLLHDEIYLTAVYFDILIGVRPDGNVVCMS